jgi:Fe-Mn family superoxide dismutase
MIEGGKDALSDVVTTVGGPCRRHFDSAHAEAVELYRGDLSDYHRYRRFVEIRFSTKEEEMSSQRTVRAEGLDRRRFLLQTAALTGLAAVGALGWSVRAQAAQEVVLPPLPYPEQALEPYISARTLQFHYGKHHRGYVKKTNNLLKKYGFDFDSLEAVVVRAKKGPGMQDLYNNASQAWNHNFYWRSMKPNGGGSPGGKLGERIDSGFGGFENFKKAFKESALGRFGSGWAWLTLHGNELRVESSPNAVSPLPEGRPLLVCDVWEHAYYLDYQNRRAEYVDNFLNHLANWDFAAENYTAAVK